MKNYISCIYVYTFTAKDIEESEPEYNDSEYCPSNESCSESCSDDADDEDENNNVKSHLINQIHLWKLTNQQKYQQQERLMIKIYTLKIHLNVVKIKKETAASFVKSYIQR